MNPITLIAGLMLLLILSLPFLKHFDSKETKNNAEFEAKNCPQMLQVDSEYCKPLEGK